MFIMRKTFTFFVSIGLSVLFFSLPVLAVPATLSFQTKIYKPDGKPLEAASVNFRFTTVDPAGTCVLYVEDFSALNLSGSGGLAVLNLGSGFKVYPTGSYSFVNIFNNLATSFLCQDGTTYNPNISRTENRKIIAQFNDGSAAGWQTLPAINVNSVPYAFHANDSEKLAGFPVDNFLQFSTLPNCGPTQVLKASGSVLSCVAGATAAADATTTTKGVVQIGAGLDVASGIVSVADLDAAKIASGTIAPARLGSGAASAANFLRGDGTWVAVPAGTVTNVTSTNAYLSVATSSTAPSLTLNVGTAASTVAAGNDSRITGALQTAAYNLDVADAISCLASEKPYWSTVGDKWMCTAINDSSKLALSGGTMTGSLEIADGTSTPFTVSRATTANDLGVGVGFNQLDSASAPVNLAKIFASKSSNTPGAIDGYLNFSMVSAGTLVERMRITSLGNVGIGTTTPAWPIDVIKADSHAIIRTRNSSSTASRYPGFNAENYMGTFGGTPKLSMINSRGTASASAPINSGDFLGQIEFNGIYDTANNQAYAALIRGVAEQNFSSTSAPSALTFGTASTGSRSSSEKMRITSAGNVGIGTTAPAGILDVQGGSSSNVNGTPINLIAQSAIQSGNSYGGNINLTSGSGFGAGGNAGNISLNAPRGTGTTGGQIKLNAYGGGNVYFDLSGSHAYASTSAATNTPANAFNLGSSWVNDTIIQTFRGTNGVNNTSAYFGAIPVASSFTSALVWGQSTGINAYSERMRMDQSGNVGIGNTVPTKLLHVGSTSVGSGLAVANFQNVDGTCTITPAASGSGIACSSDERLKENFQDVQGSFALDRILKLQAVTYNFKTASTENRRTGYKAQQMQKVAPEFVRQNEDGYFQVYYDGLIPWITEAIKIMNARVEQLFKMSEVQSREIASIKASAENDKAMKDKEIQKLKQENAAIKSYLCAKDPKATICK